MPTVTELVAAETTEVIETVEAPPAPIIEPLTEEVEIEKERQKRNLEIELIEEKTAVIFTTAFDEYAIKAFDNNAVDYLLKPFSFERFLSAINKVTASITNTTKKERKGNIEPEEQSIF